jgi:soluble lytic murein transglycosylase-like protein
VKLKKHKKHSAGWKLSILLALLFVLILVYNPISLRITTVGVAIYYGIDPGMFYRLIHSESSFRSFAVSNAQAIGLGQIRESTAFYIHKEHKRGFLFFPVYNLKLAAKYLNYLKERYHGNWSLALAAYNWGETNVSKRISGMKVDPDKDYRYLFKDIPETYNYIGKILPPKNKA